MPLFSEGNTAFIVTEWALQRPNGLTVRLTIPYKESYIYMEPMSMHHLSHILSRVITIILISLIPKLKMDGFVGRLLIHSSIQISSIIVKQLRIFFFS